MLHDMIVSVGINTNVWVFGKTELHNATEYTVSIRITTDPMDYMIWQLIIKPPTFIDSGISGFWGWQESEIANDLAVIFNDKAAIPFNISHNNSLRRVAFSPLVHVTRLPHYLLCSIHDFHNISHVRRSCFSDNPVHVQNSLSPVSSISP